MTDQQDQTPEDAQQSAQEDRRQAETAPQQETAERTDGFKSEESKQSLLADLHKAREEARLLREAEEERKRAELSEIDRAKAERDDFRTRWEQAETARIRAEVARTKGVDPELIQGATEEEMAAHADRLLAWRGDVPPKRNPNPGQGARDNAPSEDDLIFYKALGRKPQP